MKNESLAIERSILLRNPIGFCRGRGEKNEEVAA